MADKVDYSKITIDFATIISKLHQVAKSFAEKEDTSIQLDNLAFNDKDGSFIGSGQYGIFMKKRDDSLVDPEKDKKKFLPIVQTYVKYFVGEEESRYVKQDDLQPITRTNDPSGGEDKPPEEEKPPEETGSSGESPSGETTTTTTTTSESTIDYSKDLVDVLFEDAVFQEAEDDGSGTPEPSTSPEGGKPEGGEEEEKGKTEDGKEEDGKDEEKPPEDTIGFTVFYDLAINDKKDHSFKDAIVSKTKGLFGGVLADLRNIKIQAGQFGQIQIGKMFDPAKWKDAIGMEDIDIDTVAHDVQTAFDDKYHNNDIRVKHWTTKELINFLNRKRRLSPDVKGRITPFEYAITIRVDPEDPNYPDYDKMAIRDMCNKAFGTSRKLINWNKIGEDDVIKIDHCGDNSKFKPKSQLNPRNFQKDAKDSHEKTTKESLEEDCSLICYLFEEEEAPKPEEPKSEEPKEEKKTDDTQNEVSNDPIRTDEYQAQMKDSFFVEVKNKFPTEQIEKDKNYGYLSKDELIKKMTELGCDRGDIKKIKSLNAENLLFLQVQKLISSKGGVDESLDIDESDLLKLLFEGDEGETAKPGSEVERKLYDATNPSPDGKQNGKIREQGLNHIKMQGEIDTVSKNLSDGFDEVLEKVVEQTTSFYQKKNVEIESPKIPDQIVSIVKRPVEKKKEEPEPTKESHDLLEGEVDSNEKYKELPDWVVGKHHMLINAFADIVAGQLHANGYAACTNKTKLKEFLDNHHLDKDGNFSKITEEYCGIVLAKRDSDYVRTSQDVGSFADQLNEEDGDSEDTSSSDDSEDSEDEEDYKPSYKGSTNNSKIMTTTIVPKIKQICNLKSLNDVTWFGCDDATNLKNTDKNELINISLGYNQDKKKEVSPYFDIWIFNVYPSEDEKKPEPGPGPVPPGPDPVPPGPVPPGPVPPDYTGEDVNITIIITVPDPYKPEGDKTPTNDTHDQEDSEDSDLYIVTHKNFKSMSRHTQRDHHDDGSTTTTPSNAEYKKSDL